MKYLLFNNAHLDEACKRVAQEQGIDLNNVIRESIQLSTTLFTTTSFRKTCFPFDILFESFDTPNSHVVNFLNNKRTTKVELNNNLTKENNSTQ